MKFEEIINEIRTFGNVCCDCGHFIVRSTFEFCDLAEKHVQSVRDQQKNPRHDTSSKQFKLISLHILKTLLTNQDNVKPANSQIQPRQFSIYPLK